MTQDNQHHRFGYRPFDDGPQSRPSYEQPGPGGAYSDPYEQPMRRSVISTAAFKVSAFVVAAIVFGSVIYISTSSDDDAGPVPIVQAEAGPAKTRPSDIGGMDIPNRDSTIFDALNQQTASADPARRIENLLDDQSLEEMPISRDLVLQDVAEVQAGDESFVPPSRIKPSEETALQPQPAQSAESNAEQGNSSEAIAQAGPSQDALAAAVSAVEPAAGAAVPADTIKKVAEAKKDSGETVMHKPGASPDTLAFVRSVLDKKDGAGDVAAIAPAAGTPGPAVAPKSGSGSYYVQLASVTSEQGAESSWGKLKDQFSAVLGNSDYRVQKADLGAKGIYYRIQAGPYAQSDAKAICDSIKAEKPGGCLIVR